MASAFLRILLAMLFLTLILQRSEGQGQEWCIASNSPTADLQAALDWACEEGGADCTNIEANQPCYSPGTLQAHASYAFNSYYQKSKHDGGTCSFSGAAMITNRDPSYDSCKYDYVP